MTSMAAAAAVGEKRKAITQAGASTFLRHYKRACSTFQPEAYTDFCAALTEATAAAKGAADAGSHEEEAEITRQFLVDLGQADNCFVGRKAYFFELLRMLPEELVPKPAALPAADDLLVDDASDASDAADEEDDAGPAKEEMKADSLAEAFDSHRQAWSIAKVRQVQADQVMLHYVGWPNTFDSWFHRTEHADQMRPLSGKGTLGPYLQLGLTKANTSLQERIRILLFTLGKGNCVHLSSIVKHVIRPRMPREKRQANAARVLKILQRFQRMRLVALKPDQPAAGAASADGGAAAAGTEDVPVDGAATGLQASSNVLITILKPPALQGFGSGEPDSPADGGHEQTGVLDFAPGDFVEMLTPSNDWEVAQVNDVVEMPWHQLKVHQIGTREADDQWVDGDELGARLQLLKPYHRATAVGDSQLPKLGIFKETHTVTFATQAIREQMRKTTRQTATTDEQLISTKGVDEIPMKVCDTGTIKNLGAFATRDLEKGEFIAEYCGEIISNKEMKQRGLAKTSEYLFNVGGGLTIDASRFGNVTRYMNHSTNANVRPMVCNHYGCRRVVFYTMAQVASGTELCYDYGNEYVKNCKHILV